MSATAQSEPASLSRIGIVGGGFMGTGIAESAAVAGIGVTLIDVDDGALDRSRERIGASLARAVERGKLDDAAPVRDRIDFATDLGELAGAELVVEAVPEIAELKREVFAEISERVDGDVVIASNTSSIPIAELAGATSRPDRVCGLHFFSPVPVMKLVEVVVALDTSEATEAQAFALAEQMGKQPIRTKDRSGFVVNMLLIPYLMAAIRMLEEGFASREDIDAGMQLGCGHPMGPLALCDLIGLDVLYAVGTSLFDEFKRDEYAPPPLLKRMLAANRLGRKSGRGFYEYEPAAAG
ncbi:MAG TPA: 3-hydroxybutyryl-CoA dehydrogenase [Solirubrobacterales bacterium]|nr:3-hydroxybutyryl-CoA dehydrogenase [Solirubrobacterales bacterium]